MRANMGSLTPEQVSEIRRILGDDCSQHRRKLSAVISRAGIARPKNVTAIANAWRSPAVNVEREVIDERVWLEGAGAAVKSWPRSPITLV
jgi:hypothetical protein